jgi:threonine dehydrogenase-like Zn-dependent dehydrogenase
MIGIQFRKSIPRYLAMKAVGPWWRGASTSALVPISLREMDMPELPSPAWVRVRPILSGICGSDLAAICAKGSAYLSPLTSTPFVLGHEVVGTVTEVGPRTEGVSVGERVVVQPALGCCVRGIEPMCPACAANRPALCRNVTRGDVSAGIQTGYCRDTGGGWSESFVAHPSQLYRVPHSMDDEVAVLAEPFACALHGALRVGAAASGTVLVMGCGSIGLLTIAALRAVNEPADPGGGAGASTEKRLRIVAVAKYAHQHDHALRLGADEALMHCSEVGRRYRLLAEALGAELHRPEIGKPTVVGGADVTFDCVASSASIDDCCRFTRGGGDMVLVGMPSIPRKVDWTSIWYKELSLHAAYAYGAERHDPAARTTFEIGLEILSSWGSALRLLVGEPFGLRDYRAALRSALHTGESGSVKTVFRVGSAGR